MNLNPLSFIGDIFSKVADKITPDKGKIIDSQNRINEMEVSGAPASILRLWRSFLGWVLSLLFAWEVIARPVIVTYWPDTLLPPSVLGEVSRLLLGILGCQIFDVHGEFAPHTPQSLQWQIHAGTECANPSDGQ